MSDLRYPVGNFVAKDTISETERQSLIESLAQLPNALATAIDGLSAEQLDTAYRPEGWTVRQTVHHTADSHINAYVRFRLALTEDLPTIKPYAEELWAQLEDGWHADPALSLQLLDALHQRWVILLRALPASAYTRRLIHPVAGAMSLEVMLQMYEWHGRHHVAHITALRTRMGW